MTKLYHISENEFIFVPKNKSKNTQADNYNATKPKLSEAEKRLIKLKTGYSPFANTESPSLPKISVLPNLSKNENDISIDEKMAALLTTYKRQQPGFPFDMDFSNSIKITKNIIKIDDSVLKVNDIIAFRWEEPRGGSKYREYRFELKLKDNTVIPYNCRVRDGNGFWFGENEHLYTDSFHNIWPIVLNNVEKRVLQYIIIPIINSIDSGNNYVFGLKRPNEKFSQVSLTVNSKGVYLNVDALITKRTILIPWHMVSYKNLKDRITIHHKLKIADHKSIFYSEWNTFVVPILIDYMTKIHLTK